MKASLSDHKNIIVLDLVTANSAEDCISCGQAIDQHLSDMRDSECLAQTPHASAPIVRYEPIGWDDKARLGLSIGGFYSYRTDRIHWFDNNNLLATVAMLAEQQPLMVSFNGIKFDFPLIIKMLQQKIDELAMADDSRRHQAGRTQRAFEVLFSNSYDILAEIWRADPEGKFKHGLNSLGAICEANGLGLKLGHDAQAPRDWKGGKKAEVINCCQDSICKTRYLFERIRADRGYLRRGDGSNINIRWISNEGKWMDPANDELPF